MSNFSFDETEEQIVKLDMSGELKQENQNPFEREDLDMQKIVGNIEGEQKNTKDSKKELKKFFWENRKKSFDEKETEDNTLEVG